MKENERKKTASTLQNSTLGGLINVHLVERSHCYRVQLGVPGAVQRLFRKVHFGDALLGLFFGLAVEAEHSLVLGLLYLLASSVDGFRGL
jgi:hypothetical protein